MRKAIIAGMLVAAAFASVGAQAKTTITLLVPTQQNLEGSMAIFALAEQKYGIHVELEYRPSGPEGENVVKTRLAAGEMDDLCYFNSGSLLQALNPAQNFVDLTKDPMVKNAIDSYKASVTVDGRIYGVPIGTVMGGGWLYNKKLYSQFGLKVPKTWSELLANCEKIKRAGKTPVLGSYKDDWSSQLIILADFVNVQAQVPNFASNYTAHKVGFADTPRGPKRIREASGALQERLLQQGHARDDLRGRAEDAPRRPGRNVSDAHRRRHEHAGNRSREGQGYRIFRPAR